MWQDRRLFCVHAMLDVRVLKVVAWRRRLPPFYAKVEALDHVGKKMR
jgi:hypothetical protein